MKVISVMIALFAAFNLTACNTMAGFGKDLQKGGEALERSAK